MDAANPLCRCLLLAVGLAALLGCETDRASKIAPLSRGQQPTDPLAPIAPPPPTAPVQGGPVVPLGAPPVAGGPVAPNPQGPVVTVGSTTGSPIKGVSTAVDQLRAAVPRVKIVARVGESNVITDQEVMEGVYQQFRRELAPLDGHARAAKQKELYTQVLRKVIERELVIDEMYTKLKKANKLNVVEEIKEFATTTADRQLRSLRTDMGVKSDEEMADLLRTEGLTIPVIRRQMERQMMAEQYISSALREKGRRAGLAEVRDYYDKHPDQFQTPDKVRWQHLFVSFRNHPTPQAAYNHALALSQQAAAGADFAALAVKFDEGFAKNQKGFGTGEKRGEVQPVDVEPTVWALKPGQMSGILQTPTGYHIVKVVERDYAGVMPFDTALQIKIRDRITRINTEIEYKKLIDELWRKGVVRVFDE